MFESIQKTNSYIYKYKILFVLTYFILVPIYVMLRLYPNIGACYFVIQSILAKIAFSFFFLDFLTFYFVTFSNVSFFG